MEIGKLQHPNKVLLFVVLGVVFLAATYTNQDSANVSTHIESLPWIDAKKLSDGDLIFRKGHDLISRLVLTQGNSAQFSHVGIILIREGIVSVIHSLPEDVNTSSGVQVESLDSFVSIENASDVAVYRITGIDTKSRQKIREYVLKQVGKPFDTSLLMSTDDSMYCTELVVKAYIAVGITLATRLAAIRVTLINEPVIPPDHLRWSHRLERL